MAATIQIRRKKKTQIVQDACGARARSSEEEERRRKKKSPNRLRVHFMSLNG